MNANSSNSASIASPNILDGAYTWLHRQIVRYGLVNVRISIGILFLWLGILELFPGVSPAEPIMRAGMPSFLPMQYFIPFAAVWEILIGLGFISGKLPRVTLAMTFVTLCMTLGILVMAPQLIWRQFPFFLTFEGSYVVKDIVLMGTALALLATVRGGGLVEIRPQDSQVELSVSGAEIRTAVEQMQKKYNRVERRAVRWLARHSLTIVRIGIGIVFLWFGALNIIPGASPAEPMFAHILPAHLVQPVMTLVGISDILIGLGMVLKRFIRPLVIWMTFFMFTTILMFVTNPGLMFKTPPFVLTLEGQHILKNLVILSAGLVLLVPARGGGLVAVRTS